MAICQCDNWMAAKFDTYLAEYQHGLHQKDHKLASSTGLNG